MVQGKTVHVDLLQFDLPKDSPYLLLESVYSLNPSLWKDQLNKCKELHLLIFDQ